MICRGDGGGFSTELEFELSGVLGVFVSMQRLGVFKGTVGWVEKVTLVY